MAEGGRKGATIVPVGVPAAPAPAPPPKSIGRGGSGSLYSVLPSEWKGSDSPGPGVYADGAQVGSTFSLWQRSSVGKKRFLGTRGEPGARGGAVGAGVGEAAAAARATRKSKLPQGVSRSVSPSHKVPRAFSFEGRPEEPAYIAGLGTARHVPGPFDYKPARGLSKGPRASFGRDLRFWEHPLLNRADAVVAQASKAKSAPTAAQVAGAQAYGADGGNSSSDGLSADGLPTLGLRSLTGPRNSRESMWADCKSQSHAARVWHQPLSSLQSPAWDAFRRAASPPTRLRVESLIQDKTRASEAMHRRYLSERERFHARQRKNRATQKASGQASPETLRRRASRKEAALQERAMVSFMPGLKAKAEAEAEAIATQLYELDAFEDHLKALRQQGTLEERLVRELEKLERMRNVMSWRRFFKKIVKTPAFAAVAIEDFGEDVEEDEGDGNA